MNLSQMKGRITIVKRNVVINENGYSENKFEELKQIWCKVEQIKITESTISSNENMLDNKRFIVRKNTKITILPNEIYIKYKEKLYDVIGYETFNSLEEFIGLIARESLYVC